MKGRPVIGAIGGLLLGLFVAIDLQQFAVRPMDSFSLFGLPVIGLVIGLAFAAWAPFGKKKKAPPVAPQPQTPSPSEPSPPAE